MERELALYPQRHNSSCTLCSDRSRKQDDIQYMTLIMFTWDTIACGILASIKYKFFYLCILFFVYILVAVNKKCAAWTGCILSKVNTFTLSIEICKCVNCDKKNRKKLFFLKISQLQYVISFKREFSKTQSNRHYNFSASKAVIKADIRRIYNTACKCEKEQSMCFQYIKQKSPCWSFFFFFFTLFSIDIVNYIKNARSRNITLLSTNLFSIFWLVLIVFFSKGAVLI